MEGATCNENLNKTHQPPPMQDISTKGKPCVYTQWAKPEDMLHHNLDMITVTRSVAQCGMQEGLLRGLVEPYWFAIRTEFYPRIKTNTKVPRGRRTAAA